MKTAQTVQPKVLGASMPWLLAAYLLGAAPHVSRLPIWIVMLCVTLAGLRLLIQHRNVALPSRWLLVAMTVAAVAGVFLSYGTILGRDAGIALLIVMLALKLLELKNQRDVMIIVILTYFLLITEFLYSQSIPIAIYMLLVVLILTTALVLTNTQSKNETRHDFGIAALKRAGVMLMQAFPLMLLLFFLFPRITGPLWGLPDDAHKGQTGLSDSMSPGNISELSQSDSIAFRVAFTNEIPPKAERYWRGPVLEYFNGNKWEGARRAIARHPEFDRLSRPVDYTVTLEPNNKPWLLALDVPATLPALSFMTPQFQLLSQKPVTALQRYEMRSYLSYRLNPEITPLQRAVNLSLPEQSSPRSRALSGSWRAAGLTDSAIVRRALQMFREQPFVYTLNPPLLDQSKPVDDFLFNTRRGFCEHYASSFVVLMRAAGIPARVVTGYQGGEINPVDNYMLVRQSDAHAWSEVWLAEAGWVRVDPTAAVSPLRIESGLGSALPDDAFVPFMIRPENNWARQLRFSWDAVNNRWNQWVLGYGTERQKQFLSQFGLFSWRDMTIGLTLSLGIATLFIALLMLRLPGKTRADPALRAYQLLCSKLAKIGIVRAPSEGPLDFSRRVHLDRPRLASKIAPLIALYAELRYGRHRPAADAQLLLNRVRRLRVNE